MGGEEGFEYLLPCGHKSAGLACFQCAAEEYQAAERAAEKLAPRVKLRVPQEMTIAVTDPPHLQRFAVPRRRK
jgi:hypothetical protein